MARFQIKSITHKITILFAISAVASLALFFILFSIASFKLDETFWNDYSTRKISEPLASQFHYYVTEKSLRSGDTLAIRKWAEEKKVDYLVIVKDNAYVYDHSSFIKHPYTRLEQLNYALLPDYNVNFSDGAATIRVYKNVERSYYFVTYALIAILCVCVGFMIMFLGIRKEVSYIVELVNEVDKMSSGLENASFRIVGDDEISDLADAMENMRTSLIDKEQKELEMKKAQDNLVLGMAHDLRTPLTSLIAYIEIVKRQDKTEEVVKYSDKALQKAGEIKNLSDQLFDFFLINSGEKDEFEVVSIEYAFNDYLSELCSYLGSQGYNVEVSDLTWPHQNVSISFDYIGRIMNNIQSNIVKYADTAKPVNLNTKSDGKDFYISIHNAVSDHADDSSSNGIGLKNVSSMMKKMGGDCVVHTDKTDFTIDLIFAML